MKKSFMTRVLAVSLSAAMAFSVSSASNLMTASAASTVNLKTTFKTLKVNQKYQLKLTNNTLNWKITKVTTSNKKICTVYDKKASSVMLKGKGVGRAKIKVKVKTTKRKYPKNIKYMTCTANVKAADETKPPVEAAFSATVAPISSTQVRVTFNKAVDNASEAANFTVSDGVKVTKSDPSEDKLSTVLTIDGAVAGKSYDLTAKGLTVNGAAQADLTLKFTAPSDVQTGYEMTITSDPKIIKSDGQTQARVTFEVTKDGKAITTETAQIEFSASRGRFADNRATLNNGKVTVMYNAPHETVSVPAVIQATVVESSDRDMIGTTGTTSVTLSPNPDALTSEAAIITSASAGTADRVVAYFDKEVSAADFMKDGRPDTSKFECTVRSGIDNFVADNNTIGTTHNVVAFLEVPNEPKALEILVDSPMVDNSNVSVKFKDKRKNGANIDTTNTVYLKLADAREPSAMSVTTEGTKKIQIEFSEAVLPSGLASAGNAQYGADVIDNYLIDGRSLRSYGIENVERDGETATTESSDVKIESSKNDNDDSEAFNTADGKVVLHSYKVDKGVGTDNRNKVTITVGSGHPLTTGSHVLTVRNVGDWAAGTDGARNSVSTQTFPFTISEDTAKPAFTVDVQSPEQFELNFTTEFKLAANNDRFTTPHSVEKWASVLKLQEYVNGSWTDITASITGKNNPIRVSKVDGKKYIVEVTHDWSDVYDYVGTRTNYWNKQLRLHVDAGKLVNVANNLRNDEINIVLNANDANVTNGNKMGEVDTQSPTIVDVKQAVAKNGKLLDSWNVELSEPVKISGDANKEGLTPSQTQTAGINQANEDNKGVPVPYAQFINVDNPTNVVDGIIKVDQFINAQDTIINVEPETKLSGGSWRLVVGSISDDYGTTLATDSRVIEIDAATTTTDFKVVWAAVATDVDYNDAYIGNTPYTGWNGEKNAGSYVFVKFNKPVDLATALDENNYALNNQPLPHGSNIQANIQGYDSHDNVTDSVTIVLPQGGNLTQKYLVSTQNTQLSISGVVAAGTGEALSNNGMNRLPYNFGSYAEEKDTNIDHKGDDSVNAAKDFKYDAVWGNADSEKYGSNSDNIKTKKAYFEALRDALENDQYRKVIITQNIFDVNDNDALKAAKEVFGNNCVLNIKRAVNIELANGVEINGNVVVSTTDAVGSMTISGGKITGVPTELRTNKATLTVNAGSVKEFVLDDITIDRGVNDYPVLLQNVWTESFNLTDSAKIDGGTGTIYVTDADGFGINNAGTWKGELRINSNGVINLKGAFAENVIRVQQAATLNLGMYNSKGEAIDDAHVILGTDTFIIVEGNEAKVMMSDATDFANGAEPTIRLAAKDIKLCIPNNKLTDGMKNNIEFTNGATYTAVDIYGKKLSTDNINVKPEESNTVGIQSAFKAVKVLGLEDEDNKIELSLAQYRVISGGAVTVNDGTFSKAELIADCQKQVAEEVEKDKNFKKEHPDFKAADVTVTCKLDGTSLLEDRNGEIRVKANPASGKTDVIRVTLTYKNYSVTKTITIKE